MLKALSLALLLAFSSPVLADECKAPVDQVQSTLGAKVEADLSGDALKQFNANYTRITKQDAPSHFDRMLILSKPEIGEFLMVASKDGCVVGFQPISPETFKRFNAPDDGI